MTHEYPGDWAYDSVTEARVNALAGFGFTQRQREFLVTVMVHSGCFLERQYCAFTGTVRGQNSREFMARLVARGFARAIEPGPVRRGRLYHVHHKPLYEAIGQADNRNRRVRTIGRMVERVMILDAVLGDRRCWWLSPEADKRRFFGLKRENWLRPEDYPHIAFGSGRQRTIRCFPDKLPIGIEKDHTRPPRLPLPREPAPPGGLPPVPDPSRRAVPLPAHVDGPAARATTLQEGRRALQGGPPRRALDAAEPERHQALETYFPERQAQGGHLGDPDDRYIREEFRQAGDAEDPGPLSRLATTGRRVLWQASLDLLARRSVARLFGGRSRIVEPPVPPAHRHDGPRRLGQEGGQAKIASGWPPTVDGLSGHSLTPGGSMSANASASVLSQRTCREHAHRGGALCRLVYRSRCRSR